MKSITMDRDTHALICGLVHPTDELDKDAVFADDEVWEKVREIFPVSTFRKVAADEKSKIDYYGEDAE